MEPMVKTHNLLTLHGEPILTEVLPPLNRDSISQQELNDLLHSMHQVMLQCNGVGLAANQIGRYERVFITRSDSAGGYRCFINPVILSNSESTEELDEGCLSIPGVFSKTVRYKTVEVQWFDQEWVQHVDHFEGLMAQIIQHEVDHLNGVLYVDRFKPLKKQLLINKHRKYIKKSRFNRS